MAGPSSPRDHGRSRSGPTHRRRLFQRPGRGRPVSPSEIRDRPAQRPLRHSVAGRVLVAPAPTVTSSWGSTRRPPNGTGRPSGRAFAGSSPAGAGSDSTIRWTTRTPTTSSKPSASWPAAAASSCRSTGSISGRGRGPTGAIRWPRRTFRGDAFRAGDEPPAVRCPLRCASASSGPTWDEAEALAAELSTSTPQGLGDASCGDGRVPVLRASSTKTDGGLRSSCKMAPLTRLFKN